MRSLAFALFVLFCLLADFTAALKIRRAHGDRSNGKNEQQQQQQPGLEVPNFFASPSHKMFPVPSTLPTLSSDPKPPPYETYFYNQTFDHFNFMTTPKTYQERYLVSSLLFQKSKPRGEEK